MMAKGPASCSPLLLLLCQGLPLDGRGLDDASTLVQASHRGGQQRPKVSDGVFLSPNGPMALTPDGPILGAKEDGYIVFRSVPYTEPPERFGKPIPKKPWEPHILNATEFGPACIGAASSGEHGEAEDCLTLNIWLPTGKHRRMPVIVFFHGGMNQHGTGHEDRRHGDMIVQSPRFPTIFINFDFRLGIFGWIYGEPGSGITNNLGIMDQQVLLQWVQRHIGAFGGDPDSVTLWGQSEGAGVVMTHLVSPKSAGLFHRCIFTSPPADVWSRSANKDRTEFISSRAGCNSKHRLRCLRRLRAQKLWGLDWNSEALSRPGQKKEFMKNTMSLLKFTLQQKGSQVDEALADLGWHAVADGDLVPGEPRKLIAEGRWHKVPVLITTTKNESYGVLPDVVDNLPMGLDAEFMVSYLLKKGDLENVTQRYLETLARTHSEPPTHDDLMHQMLSDKIWLCDIRSLARDMARTGGKAYISLFWHSPKFDPVGAGTSSKCLEGAACHSADMLYVLPQGRGQGIPARFQQEIAFSQHYSDDVLTFVYGRGGTWTPYDATSEAVTFYDVRGPRVVSGYRKEQCKVLDSSMSTILPQEMQELR
mmetsp:Transcript_36616/g.101670  ORF Transcript_36616/g.101670 Transcript_36616/m.101670 type:complete len:591 (-) Transcript_36616:55-1827(-)